MADDQTEKHAIHYGKATIEFNLQFVKRRTLGISVQPDMQVLVKAPLNAELSQIYSKAEKRASWILEQKEYFNNFQPLTLPRQYVSGETHLYLGKQYRLKVIEGHSEEVKLKGGYLEVCTCDKENRAKVKLCLDAWYKKHAEIKFKEYLNECLQLFLKYKLSTPSIELRNMPKRWGSCTPNGKLILNPELIKAPKRSIEYVLIHELCHLIKPNHNASFFELQAKIMPDWEKWKDRLERVMA